jgi:CRP-like cAMP-binding protein
MANVGPTANILKVSAKLKKVLAGAGTVKQLHTDERLFDVEQENEGVFLVTKGKIRLWVKGYPKLDRVFSAGSLLGVPATFTGHTYSLGATAITAADVVCVGRQAFLDLMTQQPDLCREATNILSREVSYIQGALAERRRAHNEH